jgi:hypothetical protein
MPDRSDAECNPFDEATQEIPPNEQVEDAGDPSGWEEVLRFLLYRLRKRAA